jgi:uncharacterized ion transporter superfamily protein YfcC
MYKCVATLPCGLGLVGVRHGACMCWWGDGSHPHARDIQGISSQVGLHLRLSMWVHSALVGVCSHTVECVGSGPCVAQWLGLVPGLGH